MDRWSTRLGDLLQEVRRSGDEDGTSLEAIRAMLEEWVRTVTGQASPGVGSRPPFVVNTSREYTDRVKREFYSSEDGSRWGGSQAGGSSGHPSPHTSPGHSRRSTPVKSSGRPTRRTGGGSRPPVSSNLLDRVAARRERLEDLYDQLAQLG